LTQVLATEHAQALVPVLAQVPEQALVQAPG
jgi:hypothetical protein